MNETLALFEALLTLVALVAAATFAPWLVVAGAPIGFALWAKYGDRTPSRPF